jgi:hypothetical protein
MPKYVEERQAKYPVPGAFGLERSKEEWERRNRPNDQYLTRTGVYADKLYIYVDIEYGYASFLWVYPGTAKELVEDWCCRRVPWNSPNWLGHKYRGEFDPVSLQTVEADRGNLYPRRLELILDESEEVIEGFRHISDFDGTAHSHEEDDTCLKVGYYEVRGAREPEVIIHVLDALASL